MPRIIALTPAPDLAELAARAHYIGSPEHKDTPSFAGHPAPRADAAICERWLATKQALVTRWLRDAIRRGSVSDALQGAFPRYVWYKHGEVVYEARLSNLESGDYKGYPLNPDEWPRDIERLYPDHNA